MKFFGKIGFLVFTVSACLSALFFERQLDRRASRVKPVELYATINGHLNAVRRDDIHAAYRQSAASVRENFSYAQFKRMVRDDFEDTARVERIEYGAVQTRGRRAIVQVFFIDFEDRVTPCIYSLVNEGAGWKVSGTRMLKRWEVGQRLGGIRI